MTVAHKDLTGTDLHELKGAAAATAGQVPVADGAGTSPFAKLTHTSLQTTGNPFGAQLLHVREEQNSGVSSTSPMGSSFYTMVLNTVKTNEISGASLASNRISLPAGTYHCIGRAAWCVNTGGTGAGCKVRIYDVTHSTTLISGDSSYTYINSFVIGHNGFCGRFTLSGTTNIELQQYVQYGSTIGGFSGGEKEVYHDVMIWKVA